MGFFDNARKTRLQQELATGPIRPSREWFRQLAGEVPEFGDLADQIIAASGQPREFVDHAVLTEMLKLKAELWLRRAADAMQGRHPRITWSNIEIVLNRPDYSGRLLSEFLSTGGTTGSAINNKLIEYLMEDVFAELVPEVRSGKTLRKVAPHRPALPSPPQATSTPIAEPTDPASAIVSGGNDSVAQYRESRVAALQELLNACLQDRKDPAVEAGHLISQLRELYFFSADMRSLVEYVINLSTGAAISDWATQKGPIAESPWSRIGDALKAVLDEPPLYERNWSQGLIEPQFAQAITGSIDLAACARHVQKASSRRDHIDAALLIGGTTMIFRHLCQHYFAALKTPGADRLVDIFDTILRRDDLAMDMFPAALTYFGSDGLSVRNQIATEVEEIRDELLTRADRGLFDAPTTAAERTPTAATESASQALDDTPVEVAPSPPTARRSVKTRIPAVSQPVPNRRWPGLLALLGVIAVAILIAATVAVFNRNDASRSSTNAYGRDKPAATDLTAGDCSSPPSYEAQRFTVEGEQLTATIRVRSLCSDGDILASGSTQVTIQDGYSTVAAGIFDLAMSPIAIPPSGAYLDQRFAFPVGTYWRLPGTLNRMSDLAINVVELGQSSAPMEIPASQTNTASRVAVIGAPPIVDAESAAIEGLKAQADADAALVSSAIADRWIPQISSKRVGLVADGITWTNADILREHMQLRKQFPLAVLTWSGNWSTYSSPDFWVTSVGLAFPDSTSALDWCVANEFDRDHCYAHIISNSRGPQGTSAYLN
ncbi:hypothetical protein SIM91_18740 [Rhodococcus opacus]|uniref:hypothetical protein n=1 Tax=Rhodococcus opacus TaxID=37919 RepID=UPI0002A3848A|nr:hypothetical protein [Rhodococcus opacus]ELB86409.1 hypothetical protein Rwratislav_45096 [Rhodococcus wratislaviensis IFP 2016]MDX5965299.1 hypothetical protein [Rhodococcus opacus]NKY76679.1 hypothetical protein [Rhodococcus opacus]CAG7618492.1 hypothetical protein E143388_06074 [Rhodococcus opacus]